MWQGACGKVHVVRRRDGGIWMQVRWMQTQVWTWYVEAEGGHRYREAARLPLRLRVHRGEDPLHTAALETQVVVGRHREEAMRVHAQYQRPASRRRPDGPVVT